MATFHQHRSSPALVQALTHLEKLIKGGGKKFPTVLHLAADAGVGAGTMARAIKLLKEQGLITARPHCGITLAATCPPGGFDVAQIEKLRSKPCVSRQELLRDSILDTIKKWGLAEATPLPSAKALSKQFGATHTTVASALKHLEKEGWICRRSRGYAISEPLSHKGRHSIACISQFKDIARLSATTVRSDQFWRSLEMECIRRDISLEWYSMHEALGKQWTSPSFLSFLKRPATLGTIMYPIMLSPGIILDCARSAAAAGKPVAIFDEMRSMRSVPARFPAKTRIFQTQDDYTMGREMGLYLVQSGHRCVVCIADTGKNNNTFMRAQGVIDVFSALGHSPVLIAAEETEYPDETQETALQQDPLFENKVPEQWMDDFGRQLNDSIDRYLRIKHARNRIESLFERALALDGVTAWVLLNDDQALLARGFLMKKNIRVPADISLTGFDDSLLAFGNDITSYNFNLPLAALMLVRTCTGDLAASTVASSTIETIPGILMARKSCCPRHDRRLPCKSAAQA